MTAKPKSESFLGVASHELFGFLPGTTSEQRCGVMPQPAPICAIVTPIQERILEALAMIEELKSCVSPSRNAWLISGIEAALSPVESELEDMRNKCAELRKWGESWKKRTKLEMDLNSLPNAQVKTRREEITVNAVSHDCLCCGKHRQFSTNKI